MLFGRPRATTLITGPINRNSLVSISQDITRKETFILILLVTFTILLGIFPKFVFNGLEVPLSYLVL